jgi:hypothetical protein
MGGSVNPQKIVKQNNAQTKFELAAARLRFEIVPYSNPGKLAPEPQSLLHWNFCYKSTFLAR